MISKRTHTLLGAATVGALLMTTPLAAQGQWSLEGRVGSAVPFGELVEEPSPDQTAGLSFAVEGMYTFRPDVSVYFGATRHAFNCDGCRTDVSTAGAQGGLKYLFSDGDHVTPWIRGGVMLHRSSLGGRASDWGVGIDSAVGVDWLVTHDVAVVPALRLNSYESGPLSLTYLTIDLGLHLHLN